MLRCPSCGDVADDVADEELDAVGFAVCGACGYTDDEDEFEFLGDEDDGGE